MIHTFKRREHAIVVDTYSGGVHVVDDLTFEAIRLIDTLGDFDKAKEQFDALHPEESGDIFQEIRALMDAGELFTEDIYRDLSIDLRNRKTNVKAMCLNVAHTCNLNCSYCFAGQGKYNGERDIMSLKTAKRAIDFLIEQSGTHRNLDVDFFGGEPMLNWDVVKETLLYAKSREKEAKKTFRFTFTTNGMLLDREVEAFLNEHMDNVVLSLDGRKEVHDMFRKTYDNKGSYDTIVPKFQRFVESRGDKEYYVRGTYTKNNRDFTEDIFHMADLSFKRLSMEPVIGDPSKPYMLSMEDLPYLEDQYDRLADDMIKRDDPYIFYHFMLNLEGGPCIQKRINGCGSGTEYMAVTPNGDLYPCHQFIGDKKFILGNVHTGLNENPVQKEFLECNCYAREECKDCWAKLYCSGGCSANAYHATGSLKGTVPLSCALFKKRMECALDIKVSELMKNVRKDSSL